MVGYEVRDAIKDNNEKIIIKFDEVSASRLNSRVDSDINKEIEDLEFSHSTVYLIVVSTILLIIICITIYKKMIKNIAASVISA